jgi:hypothetical protein
LEKNSERLLSPDGRFVVNSMSQRKELVALKNLLSETDQILATTPELQKTVPPAFRQRDEEISMPKRVDHMKTNKAEVRVHFRGKRMELTVVLPPDMEKQLAYRLASPKRFPNPRKKK